jgi:hypothetical protein
VTPIRDPAPVRRLGFLSDVDVPDDFDELGREEIAGVFGAQ